MNLTSPLTIHVDPGDARALREAPEEDRKKAEMFLALQLRSFLRTDPDSLLDEMDRAGREAEANGMTPEILESILNDGG